MNATQTPTTETPELRPVEPVEHFTFRGRTYVREIVSWYISGEVNLLLRLLARADKGTDEDKRKAAAMLRRDAPGLIRRAVQPAG